MGECPMHTENHIMPNTKPPRGLKPFTVVLSIEGRRPSVDDLEILQVEARGPRSAVKAAFAKLMADALRDPSEDAETIHADVEPFLCFEGHGKARNIW
jgi:hypothetical protein